MIILGIDPGSRRIGYGLIKKEKNKLEFIKAGILDIKGSGRDNAILEVKRELKKLVKKFQPEILAVEKLYFVKNQKTGLEVAETRGVIILTGLESNLQIKEYTPNEIKAGIAGYGFADKKAVLKMVKLILNKPSLKIIDDASDALAIAILAAQRANFPGVL